MPWAIIYLRLVDQKNTQKKTPDKCSVCLCNFYGHSGHWKGHFDHSNTCTCVLRGKFISLHTATRHVKQGHWLKRSRSERIWKDTHLKLIILRTVNAFTCPIVSGSFAISVEFHKLIKWIFVCSFICLMWKKNTLIVGLMPDYNSLKSSAFQKSHFYQAIDS